MRGLQRLVFGCGLAGLLGACGHTVELTPLNGGEPGVGGTSFAHAPLTIKLDGKVYNGHWRTDAAALPAPQPKVAAPIQVGRYYGMRGAGGYSVADFTAKDGSSLVCRFRFERGQENGSGLCQSDQGRTFAMRID